MKILFLGVGAAFTTAEYFQSNMLLTADSGKKLLIDCGSDLRFAMAEAGVGVGQIDALYLSHQHADHLGGVEWLAYATFFAPSLPRPKLFIEENLAQEAWEHSLKGGLSCVDDYPRDLSSFFDLRLQKENGQFVWEGVRFSLYKMPHVMTKLGNLYSYGLLIEAPGREPVFISTDTIFAPEILEKIGAKSALIFHDCETKGPPSLVHCHYQELRKLPKEFRAKTWLYHYQPNPQFDAVKDGFLGFVQKGQEFEFPRA
ncbi:MAG: hypothetical protein A2527_01610 [Candidatus Lambdaproteobacteria bacterium RIFOXYD2_FULL_50_16]|uniref:Metallo-beta-lactamase domain-containing protein n=1 Tax=Candidatus Lambdaproteobacteria bacterium RIFOXYD2_FULL_50_16 TaxID=1817772 RepID=A0A1F6G5K3_9PROT|nr:MAG: hypothetical protein A2527_01610 [Candidatus Lambdaproteobacteria bacterium RIFOXYD2_FULL_50_16]